MGSLSRAPRTNQSQHIEENFYFFFVIDVGWGHSSICAALSATLREIIASASPPPEIFLLIFLHVKQKREWKKSYVRLTALVNWTFRLRAMPHSNTA